MSEHVYDLPAISQTCLRFVCDCSNMSTFLSAVSQTYLRFVLLRVVFSIIYSNYLEKYVAINIEM